MFLTCKHVLPLMEAQGSGAIVNIGSVAGIRYLGVPCIAYNTTKGAVLAFTRSVALQYARKGIRANTILPGLMDTPMVDATLPGAYAAGDLQRMKEIRNTPCPMGRMEVLVCAGGRGRTSILPLRGESIARKGVLRRAQSAVCARQKFPGPDAARGPLDCRPALLLARVASGSR